MVGTGDPIIAEFIVLSRKYNTLFESQHSTKHTRDAETQVTPITFLINDLTFNKEQPATIKNSEPML